METDALQQTAKVFFDTSTIPLYFLGFITFLITLLDDWLNPKKTFKRFLWYVQEFLYTIISIALGISICFAMETSQSICWVVAIVAGLIGSTLIRRIRNQKETIVDEVIDSIKKKAKTKIEN